MGTLRSFPLPLFLAALLLALSGCDRGTPSNENRPAQPAGEQRAAKVKLQLNWVAEPEFGGFYEAQRAGFFQREHLEVDIVSGAPGMPTWQMVAAGSVEFAVATAEDVIIARSKGADVVAVFTSFQTCPQGIMAHESRGLKSIAEVFKSGTVAMEPSAAYSKFLEKKYGFEGVKVVTYGGGVTQFLADPNYAQQCFVFSEPIEARRRGATPRTFLIADSGYDPYTVVLIVRGSYLKQQRNVVDRLVRAVREGWEGYINDPAPANLIMQKINKVMLPETFTEAAEAQEALLMSADTASSGMGWMNAQRWTTLIGQLLEIGLIEAAAAPKAEACFVNPLEPRPFTPTSAATQPATQADTQPAAATEPATAPAATQPG